MERVNNKENKKNNKENLENYRNVFSRYRNYREFYGLFYSAAYFGTLFVYVLCNFQLIMKPMWINY
jgi:hypothetical protein